ncbi:hypothetical protein ACFQE1_10885 [Halobium palmae]|uniref:Uncharacterized protein n=1 Tax=Halobium palmae TaxID=1776492 RepID=A0ABD5S1T3_9EURY
MPEIGDETDRGERIAANAGAEKEAWGATLDDMRALAEEYEAEGWSTVTIQAGYAAPTTPGDDDDRFGLVYVIPGNEAEPFVDAVEAGEFPRFEVHRAEVEGKVFLVTTLLDPGTETAILLAGTYEMRNALRCARMADDRGEMFTHVQKLDGTRLGSFRHEEHEQFFPSITAIENWADVDGAAMDY